MKQIEKIRIKEVIEEQIEELRKHEISKYEFIDRIEKIVFSILDKSFDDKDFNGKLFI